MLELRPNCEWCGCDLPPESPEARICSYECTYCASCVEQVLGNVCATCGGNLVPRPIRPKFSHRPELGLGLRCHPPGQTPRKSRWSETEVAALRAKLEKVLPSDR